MSRFFMTREVYTEDGEPVEVETCTLCDNESDQCCCRKCSSCGGPVGELGRDGCCCDCYQTWNEY